MSDPLGGLSPAPEEPRPEQPQGVHPRRPATPTTWALLGVLAAMFVAEGLVGHDGSVESSVVLLRLGALLRALLVPVLFWGWRTYYDGLSVAAWRGSG